MSDGQRGMLEFQYMCSFNIQDRLRRFRMPPLSLARRHSDLDDSDDDDEIPTKRLKFRLLFFRRVLCFLLLVFLSLHGFFLLSFFPFVNFFEYNLILSAPFVSVRLVFSASRY